VPPDTLAVILPVPPLHIGLMVGKVIVIAGLTVTCTLSLAVQPALVLPVTVYEVVELGVTVIDEVVGPVFQIYVDAPVAVNTALLPGQIIDGLTLIDNVGVGLTVIFTLSFSAQPKNVAINVYVIFEAGFAVTIAEFVELNEVLGLQLYDDKLGEAESDTGFPLHIVVEGVAVIDKVNVGCTTI
jgi:hypothetical protein